MAKENLLQTTKGTSSVELKYNYGFADSLNHDEMIAHSFMDGWKECYQRALGRVYGIKSSQIKDIFDDLVAKDYSALTNDLIRYVELGRNGSVALYPDFVIITSMGARDYTVDNKMFYSDLTIYCTNEKKLNVLGDALEKALGDHIRSPHTEIAWFFKGGSGIDEATFPVKQYNTLMDEAYPFIPNVNAWIDRFINSKSNVLILNGPMGTGKSSLIGHMINRGKFVTMTAFDEKIMKDDYLYTSFISQDYNLMVLEDSDLLLLGRQEKDNDTMSKLLNVSEGIIDTQNKKIIFTANLGNIKDVDQALLRPGRCFDVVEFRDLTLDEANVVRAKIGKKSFEKNRTYSLAQIYQTE